MIKKYKLRSPYFETAKLKGQGAKDLEKSQYNTSIFSQEYREDISINFQSIPLLVRVQKCLTLTGDLKTQLLQFRDLTLKPPRKLFTFENVIYKQFLEI